MIPKHQEDTRLTQYLNKLLDEMPLSEPSPMLAERVMRRIQSAEIPETPKNPHVGKRKQWVNSFVAIAATMLLMQSGIINKIMHINSGITQITAYIQHLSQYL
ncbi:hypothetical protein [Paenibacillus alginolyticus]|uniref:Uncharacterized protein n=1 Tax=Paenibacillus alginolyticus TaxID=59839 RepID=A0ABT4GEH6_9BACL|nr:hypothetical protein [Paenibacillus alginolyticus]MCY9694586.1 hypothetical protein [Paenibacillus alginolyticus]MEC0148153.1 hypothetical protein [Paenibacillus alginolyticus]